ncbi:MAG TPA: NAD(P)-binding domain-containing protein, partial [Streptosporangiaceae bacterium]|nr:NAD(P)-binding domain-containing protein [Streptosporangiaceae bacterium]
MSNAADVAIVGAGPYGLSLAAHLRRAGVAVREFGMVMHPWRTAMPAGMFLKSQGFASNLSDPDGSHTLAAFCRATGRPYADYGLPVPLDTFIEYGRWFAAELVPDLEETLVTAVTPAGDGFEVSLATGETARARRVVIATGIEHFPSTPPELAGLPAQACTHASAHADLSVFAGQQVVVVGAGQSALETAALLHEHGADVRIVMREQEPVWNGPPLALDRPLWQRMAEPEAGLGSGWSTWFYSRHPKLFRHLPEATRVYRARTALGPAGASWLRPRVEGQIPILSGQKVSWAKAGTAGVALGLSGHDGGWQEILADHVIAATGYRADLSRLAFLRGPLRDSLRTVAGTPAVDGGYQSSVPGLYF